MADGPRALQAGEWEQLNELVSTVFRPEMFHDYPQLFNEQNRENLRVVAQDGKLVCHVGMVERAASLAGCRIDVACIGAVSTFEAYRGQGFASQTFQDCCDKAAADGIDVMLISGARGLYTRVGCRSVGQDWDFTLDRQACALLAGAGASVSTGDHFELSLLAADRIAGLQALYLLEPARFLRPLEDWAMAFDCGVVMNTAADFWGLSSDGTLIAYLIVHQPDKRRGRGRDRSSPVRVVEYAGERVAIARALPRLLDYYGQGGHAAHDGVERLTIHVQGTDPVLRVILSRTTGLMGTPSTASGTLRVINFPQLMERCRPLLAERIGLAAARTLSFHADQRAGSATGGFTISSDAGSLRLADLAILARFLFGAPATVEDQTVEDQTVEDQTVEDQTVEDQTPAAPHGSAELTTLMHRALPLPSLWYGVNYV